VGEIEISERSGGVRVVRLNRPDRLNALTPDMVRLITEAMDVGRDHRAGHRTSACPPASAAPATSSAW
jgi:enoyl-CoA hydratase/carnithine racemase